MSAKAPRVCYAFGRVAPRSMAPYRTRIDPPDREGSRWRATVHYTEPLYALTRGIPEREYRVTVTVRAASEQLAREAAIEKFGEMIRLETVGWRREIVRVQLDPY